MKQLHLKYAKFIASYSISLEQITIKIFKIQRNGQKGTNKSCSEYLNLYIKFHFWNIKIRDNFGTEPLPSLLCFVDISCYNCLDVILPQWWHFIEIFLRWVLHEMLHLLLTEFPHVDYLRLTSVQYRDESNMSTPLDAC